jgi:hypothetical protein
MLFNSPLERGRAGMCGGGSVFYAMLTDACRCKLRRQRMMGF